MSDWQPRKEFFKNDRIIVSELKEPMPDPLVDWLSKLNLLYGVPFQYLVPDERMLPPESIRFFYLDENWINSISDGAFSIGRITSSDIEHDTIMIEKILSETKLEVPKIRRKLMNRPINDMDSDEADPSGLRTGFLLRSAIVEGWPGLEVVAKQSDEKELPILRMERLSKDVLLCIFKGEFQKLELKEPAEAMHFGVDLNNGIFSKKLRGLGAGNIELGAEMQDAIVENVPTRATASRTLDVLTMVDKIKCALHDHGELGKYFSSAEFAVEMVESGQTGVFKNE